MTIIKIGLPATVATLKRRRAASLMLLDVFPIITLLPLFPPITTSSSPPTIFSISPILVCLFVSRSSSLTSYQTSPANQTQGYLPPRHSCQPSTTSSFPLTFPLFPLTPTNPISPLFFAPFFPPTNSLSFPFSPPSPPRSAPALNPPDPGRRQFPPWAISATGQFYF